MSTATIRTRASPIIIGAAASAVVLAIAGIAALAGWLPVAKSQTAPDRAARPRVEAARDPGAGTAACATCGVVEAVRVVEVKGEPRAAGESGRTAGTRASYRVTVRMSDGSYRTLAQPTAPMVAVGDRVRVADGAVLREN
jgi:hypothetical protein